LTLQILANANILLAGISLIENHAVESFRTGEMAGQLGITAKPATDNGTHLTTVHVNNKGVAIFSKAEYNEKPTDEAEKKE